MMRLKAEFEERMRLMLKDEYADFSRALSENAYSGIRINSLRNGARDAVIKEFGELEAVEWCADGLYADKALIKGYHPYHAAGLFYFQEPSAMCAAEGLPINAGDRVLDLCAAPGGKATQLGAKLRGSGILVANEIIKSRAAVLSENTERMGIKNAVVTNEPPQRLAEKYPLFFDKILVDAPCSGEGMFRKEPAAADEWSAAHSLSCAARQKKILDSADKMLRSGGLLMYSTCTFAPEENEGIVAYMLEKGYTLVHMPELDSLESGRGEWSGSDFDMSLTRRVFPHKQKGEGHFAALLRKSGEEVSPAIAAASFRAKGGKRYPCEALKTAVSLYRDFENESLNYRAEGKFALFGERLYLCPEGIDIDGIRALRCGLELGEIRKSRFVPAHALAVSLCAKDFKSAVSFGVSDGVTGLYLRGNTFVSGARGWSAVCVNGFVLGWGKGADGVMKNHYPKRLRLP